MAATQQPRRRRRKNNTTTELPVDVIFNNILPRLPAKYVKKYLCVSKEWYSFLKSPMFANMHVNHATNDDHQNHHKLLVLYTKWGIKGGLCYSNRDFETQKPGMRRRRPLPFGRHSDHIYIESSCNGLVLVALRCDHLFGIFLADLIIWNPLTNDNKTIWSRTDQYDIPYYSLRLELYYISSEQDYRVLLITGDDNEKAVYIYSLKSDSWRRINLEYCIPNSIPLGRSPSTCWNEKLFFKKLFPNEILTMFDTKTEKFTDISTSCPIQYNWNSSSVIVQRGSVHMCIKQTNPSFEPCIKLWSMDRTGLWENTSTYYKVDLENKHKYMEPMHLMRDGNWLMKDSNYYYKVDLENKHNEDGPDPYKLQGSVEGVYIETFVSPNHYVN